MKRPDRFLFDEDVLNAASDIGIWPDTDRQLQTMCRYSTPFSGGQGNRRYDAYALRIEGDRLVSIKPISQVGEIVVEPHNRDKTNKPLLDLTKTR